MANWLPLIALLSFLAARREWWGYAPNEAFTVDDLLKVKYQVHASEACVGGWVCKWALEHACLYPGNMYGGEDVDACACLLGWRGSMKSSCMEQR